MAWLSQKMIIAKANKIFGKKNKEERFQTKIKSRKNIYLTLVYLRFCFCCYSYVLKELITIETNV